MMHTYTITLRASGAMLDTVEAADEWSARDAYAARVGSFDADGAPLFRSGQFKIAGFRPAEFDAECA